MRPENLNKLTTNIAAFISLSGTSLNAMSQATGINYATLMRIRGGKVKAPRASTLNTLASYMGLTTYQLINTDATESANWSEENPPRPHVEEKTSQFLTMDDFIEALREIRSPNPSMEKLEEEKKKFERAMPAESLRAPAKVGKEEARGEEAKAVKVETLRDVYGVVNGTVAGTPIEFPSWLLPQAPGAVVLFPNGDPYTGPAIPPGAWVAIDIARKPKSGDYVLAHAETVSLQTLGLRRYQRIDDKELLLTGDREVRHCAKVLGVVIGVFTVF